LKLVEIVMMSMLKFIEDEWTFSTHLHSWEINCTTN
jgi:hypothetical protein